MKTLFTILFVVGIASQSFGDSRVWRAPNGQYRGTYNVYKNHANLYNRSGQFQGRYQFRSRDVLFYDARGSYSGRISGSPWKR